MPMPHHPSPMPTQPTHTLNHHCSALLCSALHCTALHTPGFPIVGARILLSLPNHPPPPPPPPPLPTDQPTDRPTDGKCLAPPILYLPRSSLSKPSKRIVGARHRTFLVQPKVLVNHDTRQPHLPQYPDLTIQCPSPPHQNTAISLLNLRIATNLPRGGHVRFKCCSLEGNSHAVGSHQAVAKEGPALPASIKRYQVSSPLAVLDQKKFQAAISASYSDGMVSTPVMRYSTFLFRHSVCLS